MLPKCDVVRTKWILSAVGEPIVSEVGDHSLCITVTFMSAQKRY